jgi:cell division septal protein FtsQ
MARKRKIIDELKEKTEDKPEKQRAVLTAFILLMPVLILAMTGLVSDLVIRIALFTYEAIIINNFVDDHYSGR